MIRGYADHAANERTFLAWVRTGIAVIVFGFVIEKFNLFLVAMASATAMESGRARRWKGFPVHSATTKGSCLLLSGWR